MILLDKPSAASTRLETLVDSFEAPTWERALSTFSDANIYNTWPYEATMHPRSRVSRILLSRDGTPVGAVQARILMLPVLGRGLAFIRWGPMWRPRTEEPNPENLRSCLRAIFQEYVVRRKLLVRIIPALYEDDGAVLGSVFLQEGFHRTAGKTRRRTLIMDLRPSMEEIRDNLHVKWRAHLKRAMKKDQQVIIGQTDDLFVRFESIYSAMRQRKGFVTFTDFQAFRRLQGPLAPAEKPLVVLCGAGSDYYSGAIVSALGEVGLYLFGATNGHGLENNGSYPVQWRAIEWLKEQGCREYDLNGINPEVNPTTYMYKSRLAGKTRREVQEMGEFEACVDPLGRTVTRAGLAMAQAWRTFRMRRNQRLNPQFGGDGAES